MAAKNVEIFLRTNCTCCFRHKYHKKKYSHFFRKQVKIRLQEDLDIYRMIKLLRLHHIQLRSLLSVPQKLFADQLAFRTISDSDEEDVDFGGRPLRPWEKVNKSFNFIDDVIGTLEDEQSRLLVS